MGHGRVCYALGPMRRPPLAVPALRFVQRAQARAVRAPLLAVGFVTTVVAVCPSGCKSSASVLLPERPPAPLDRPIGIEDEPNASPGTSPPQPPLGVPIGSAEPLQVVAVAPDGQWVASCRRRAASEDEPWSPQLIVGTDERIPVDRFVAFDPTGRHVVFVQDGASMLLDTHEGSHVRLRDHEPSEQPWVAFDAMGSRVAYLATTDDGPRIRVRSLLGRVEREIDPGPGDPVMVHLEPSDALRVEVIVPDGPGESRRSPLGDEGDALPASCRPTSWRPAAGARETRYARVDDGNAARAVPGALAVWHDGLLVRSEDGTILWRRRGGDVAVVAAECRGRVLHRNVREARLLVACGATTPMAVRLYHLERTDPSQGFDELGTFDAESLMTRGRWWVDPGRDRILLADPPRMIEVDGVEAIVHATRKHALARRAGDHVLVDLTEGRFRVLDEITQTVSSEVLQAGSMVVVVDEGEGEGASIIDLELGRVHGRTDRRPLAVTRSGHVLVAADDDAESSHGPLVWRDPSR